MTNNNQQSLDVQIEQTFARFDALLDDANESILIADRLVQSGLLRVSHSKAGTELTESQAQRLIAED